MTSPIKSKLVANISRHTSEGYALGWSPVASGTLASGDLTGVVYVHHVDGDQIGVYVCGCVSIHICVYIYVCTCMCVLICVY